MEDLHKEKSQNAKLDKYTQKSRKTHKSDFGIPNHQK
jgi:hypothetical protein